MIHSIRQSFNMIHNIRQALHNIRQSFHNIANISDVKSLPQSNPSDPIRSTRPLMDIVLIVTEAARSRWLSSCRVQDCLSLLLVFNKLLEALAKTREEERSVQQGTSYPYSCRTCLWKRTLKLYTPIDDKR